MFNQIAGRDPGQLHFRTTGNSAAGCSTPRLGSQDRCTSHKSSRIARRRVHTVQFSMDELHVNARG